MYAPEGWPEQDGSHSSSGTSSGLMEQPPTEELYQPLYIYMLLYRSMFASTMYHVMDRSVLTPLALLVMEASRPVSVLNERE